MHEDMLYVPVSLYSGHSFGHNEPGVVVLNAFLKTVFSWARSLHFMMAKQNIFSLVNFVELARVNPEIGTSSIPFVTWHSHITTRLLASSYDSDLPNADASSRKKTKKLKAAITASAAAAALATLKGPCVFPDTALR